MATNGCHLTMAWQSPLRHNWFSLPSVHIGSIIAFDFPVCWMCCCREVFNFQCDCHLLNNLSYAFIVHKTKERRRKDDQKFRSAEPWLSIECMDRNFTHKIICKNIRNEKLEMCDVRNLWAFVHGSNSNYQNYKVWRKNWREHRFGWAKPNENL